MEKKTCSCCGAPLKSRGWDGWICEYCGTKFDTGLQDIHIQVDRSGTLTLMSQTEIEDYWVKNYPEIASKQVVERLSASLADTLKEYMTVSETFDPKSFNRVYRGMIKIVPQGGRYY